jgi:putative ABC transport system permease protein
MRDWTADIEQRLASLRLDPAREAEIVEELSEHLDQRYAELRDRGGDDAAAIALVRAELLDDDTLAELMRPLRQAQAPPPVVPLGAPRRRPLGDLWQDLRLAVRMLSKQWALSFTVLATLALGIGASAAMYSLLKQVILEQLPVQNSEELVSIKSPGAKPGRPWFGLAVRQGADPLFSYPMFRDLQDRQRTLSAFSGIAGHGDFIANTSYESVPTYENGVVVSGNYFEVLKVRAALGRLIGPEDDARVDEGLVVVVSYQYWRDRLGSDPNIVGKQLTVNVTALTIVGVAPESFAGVVRGYVPAVYVPLTARWLMSPDQPRDDTNRQSFWLYLFGRLAHDATSEQAQAQLDTAYRNILVNVDGPLFQGTEGDKAKYLDGRIVLEPGARGAMYTSFTASNPLTIALAVTLLVLLIVCGNVANLLLARGVSRAGEMAIRASLGADRRRLVGQLLTESTLLALLGGMLAIPIALGILRLVTTQFPRVVSGGLASAAGSGVIAFAAGMALLTVILFGLAPALFTVRSDPARVIKTQSGQSPGGRGVARLRGLLVTTQISLSLVLLVLAGLFAQSLANVAQVTRGIDIDHVVGVTVSPALNGIKGQELDALYERMREELAALPGVDSVASAPLPILLDIVFPAGVTVDPAQEGTDGTANVNPMVSPGFFETFSIPLLAGRDFVDADADSPNAVIVNESFVRKFDLGPNALGKTIRLANTPYVPQDPVEIVGVVGDAQTTSVKGAIAPQVYTTRPRGDTLFASRAHYVRSDLDVGTVTVMIQRAMQGINPTLATGINPVANVVKNRTSNERLMSLLSATFAALAAALAALGLYGVLAFNVAKRKRELGLRLALGASPRGLRALVLKDVALMGSIGAAIGVPAALVVGRVAQAQLYGISGVDVLSLGIAFGVLGAALLLATYFPARQASNVAPMEALRCE